MLENNKSDKFDKWHLLQHLVGGQICSGEVLATTFGVSRAAVWKKIKQLRLMGAEIETISGQGYRLISPSELLNKNVIASCLEPRLAAAVKKIDVFNCIDSTNNYLLEVLNNESFQGMRACFAELQTKGRGRRGRKHHAGIGSCLMGSFTWSFDAQGRDLSVLSLIIALCIAQSLEDLGCDNIALKWPNDIQYAGKKLGGVLVESSLQAFSHCHVVVGFFVNIDLSERDKSQIDQSCMDVNSILVAKNLNVSRNKLAAQILSRAVQALCDFENHGPEQLLEAWQKYDALTGKPIVIKRDAMADLQAISLGITPQGYLRVRTAENKNLELSYGEVSVRPL